MTETPPPAASNPIESYDPRNHPAQLIRRVHQRAVHLFTQPVRLPNLSAAQFVSLVTLLKTGAIALGQLGRLTSMDPATTTVVVRKLEKDGLVLRSSSATDQRASMIELTDAGRTCAIAHIPISLQAGDALLAPLSFDERALFIALLHKVLAAESKGTA